MSNTGVAAAGLQASSGVSRSGAAVFVSCLLCLAVCGCASWQAPTTIDDSSLRERAVTSTSREVQVSAAVFSAGDNQRYFSANLNDSGIQTIWVEIVNNSSQVLWLLRAGTDPDYFAPLEVAWPFHKKLARDRNNKVDAYFDSLTIASIIPAGETRSGILYTNPHRGIRVLNIDLLGQQSIIPFTLFPPVPGEVTGERVDELEQLIAASQANDYQDEAAFRKALEDLPCCATDAGSSADSGPLNMIFVGGLSDIGAALVRRDYRQLPQPLDKTQRVFGRSPDIVLRKAGQGGSAANWLRLWVAPLRYQGQLVVLVQAGRPVGGRFRAAADNKPLLHPDVDEIRSLVLQDLLYSGGLEKFGFVEGANTVTEAQLFNHPGEFSYYTDGLREVLFFITRPLGLADVEFLDWVPLLERRAAEAAAQNTNNKTDEQDRH